jgi:integrase
MGESAQEKTPEKMPGSDSSPGSGALAPTAAGAATTVTADLEQLTTLSAAYATRAFGAGTRRAYRSAWNQFTTWCGIHALDPFAGTAGPLPLYAAHMAHSGKTLSTIRVSFAGIATAYRMAGHALDLKDPKIAPVLEGIARTVGSRPRRKVRPAVPDVLKLMLAQCGRDEIFRAAIAARNRAMLLIGFGAALRRSEIVSLALGDTEIIPDRGIVLLIRHSKTDQQAQGHQIGIWANPADPQFCPMVALQNWLEFRKLAKDQTSSADIEIEAGAGEAAFQPLFCAVTKGGVITGAALSDKAVVRLIKEVTTNAGLDPKIYAGHSLRAGLMTAAVESGGDISNAMRQSRHVSVQTAMGYFRPADLWRNNVTEALFRRG